MRKLVVITNPGSVPDELKIIRLLLGEGLQYLHLRKPEQGQNIYRVMLEGIPAWYHKYIVLHEHFELLADFPGCGIHLTAKNQQAFQQYCKNVTHTSASVHSFDEVKDKDLQRFNYMFLSPVFKSISKQGYGANIQLEQANKLLPGMQTPIVALGGIYSANAATVFQNGFSGIAVLGALWKNKELELMREYNKLKKICKDPTC